MKISNKLTKLSCLISIFFMPLANATAMNWCKGYRSQVYLFNLTEHNIRLSDDGHSGFDNQSGPIDIEPGKYKVFLYSNNGKCEDVIQGLKIEDRYINRYNHFEIKSGNKFGPEIDTGKTFISPIKMHNGKTISYEFGSSNPEMIHLIYGINGGAFLEPHPKDADWSSGRSGDMLSVVIYGDEKAYWSTMILLHEIYNNVPENIPPYCNGTSCDGLNAWGYNYVKNYYELSDAVRSSPLGYKVPYPNSDTIFDILTVLNKDAPHDMEAYLSSVRRDMAIGNMIASTFTHFMNAVVGWATAKVAPTTSSYFPFLTGGKIPPTAKLIGVSMYATLFEKVAFINTYSSDYDKFPGDWRNSCISSTFDHKSGRLSALCRTPNNLLWLSSINVDKCTFLNRGIIENLNGKLVCSNQEIVPKWSDYRDANFVLENIGKNLYDISKEKTFITFNNFTKKDITVRRMKEDDVCMSYPVGVDDPFTIKAGASDTWGMIGEHAKTTCDTSKEKTTFHLTDGNDDFEATYDAFITVTREPNRRIHKCDDVVLSYDGYNIPFTIYLPDYPSANHVEFTSSNFSNFARFQKMDGTIPCLWGKTASENLHININFISKNK